MSQIVKKIQINKFINKTILVRVDFNCPIRNGKILDTTRIDLVLTGLMKLIKAGAKIILLSHVGRPKGKKISKFSLKPICNYLEIKLAMKVCFISDYDSKKYKEIKRQIKDKKIVIFENLRFDPREEASDPEFAKELSEFGDYYVNDAFSCSHRSHASIEKIPKFIDSYVGFHMEKELKALNDFFETPKKPMLAIIGGSKVSTKIEVLKNLLKKVDHIVLGGAMSNTFLHSKGYYIGNSMFEKDYLNEAKEIMDIALNENCLIHLPLDCIIADKFEEGEFSENCLIDEIPKNKMVLDIGKKTVKKFKNIINLSKTVFWNGPLGAYEIEPFQEGTFQLAKYVALKTKTNELSSISGGGDTISVLNKAKVTSDFNYVSLAGGALLEYLEGRSLPGIKALEPNNF